MLSNSEKSLLATLILFCTTTCASAVLDQRDVLYKRLLPGQEYPDVVYQQFCTIAGHDSAIVNNQLYVIGGELDHFANNNTNNYFNVAASRYFAIDTITSFKTSDPNSPKISVNFTTPPLFPLRGGNIVWPLNNDLYVYGGDKAILYDGGNNYGYDNATTVAPKIYEFNIGGRSANVTSVATQGSRLGGRSGGAATSDTQNTGYYVGGSRTSSNDPNAAVGGAVTGLLAFNASSSEVTIMTTVGLNAYTTFSGGSLDYIPIGNQGILIALGGYSSPIDGASGSNVYTPMSDVAIFDIGSQQWYHQSAKGANSTSGLPTEGVPNRQSFCTVVTQAPDNSSYHIYLYGGNNANSYFETVHVLSLPSFQWTLAAAPKYSVARLAHSCNIVSATNRQMLVIGGIMKGIDENYNVSGAYEVCRPDLMYQTFDLTAHEWSDTYDPAAAPYELNADLVKIVGGTPQGGATAKGPTAGYDNPSVARIFNVTFPVTTISVNPNPPTATSTTIPTQSAKPSSSSNAGAIVGGVVGGVAALILIALAAFLVRRKSRKQQQMQEVPILPTYDNDERLQKPAASEPPMELASAQDEYALVNKPPPMELSSPQDQSALEAQRKIDQARANEHAPFNQVVELE